MRTRLFNLVIYIAFQMIVALQGCCSQPITHIVFRRANQVNTRTAFNAMHVPLLVQDAPLLLTVLRVKLVISCCRALVQRIALD